jgi:Ca2+-binding RTX toxin-like protein
MVVQVTTRSSVERATTFLIGGSGADVMTGGDGTDTLSYGTTAIAVTV